MLTLKVEGMTCAHCERAVTDAIRGVDPAAHVEVERAAGTVRTDSQAGVARLAEAIRTEGYQVHPLAT